jgi:Dyp-type peroxidase family
MNLSDIQGLVFHPYKRLPHGAYVMLRFRDHREDAAQAWLAELLNTQSIDTATPKESGPPGRAGVRLNIAFTYTGLVALGLHKDALSTFPLAFKEGLGATWKNGEPDHRSRALGDVGEAAPEHWKWGREDERVDAVLLIFATELVTLIHEVRRWTNEAVDKGAIRAGSSTELFGMLPIGDGPVREPFGFVDGISQPVLKGAKGLLGSQDKQPPSHALDDGEILLGHVDGDRQIAATPSVDKAHDRDHVLPVAFDDPERRDIGYNGTYLVFRQLEQDVKGFNDACTKAANATNIPLDRFKALLVGRWQDGSPVAKCPIAHDPEQASAPSGNDFDYRSDPNGERCPIGAHIRRANPRDSLGEHAEESLRVTNRHRILRRGRPYEDGGTRGLHFICLNASIDRQFEFIQQNWLNDNTFGGLDGEDDPIVGQRLDRAASGAVTLPPPADSRWRNRIDGLSRFVTVKGGAYFFLPSLTALRFLAGLPAARPRYPTWTQKPERLYGHERVRFLFLVRFQILLIAVLVLGPWAASGKSALATITRPMFTVGSLRDMLIVSAQASLAASMAMVAYRVTALHAGARFGVNSPSSDVLTWKRVLRWQAVSMPIVGMTLWLSVEDAIAGGRNGELTWQLLTFGIAAFGGYAAAFLLVLAAEIARTVTVRPENADNAMLLPPLRALDRFMKRSRSKLQQFGTGRWTSNVVRFFEGIARFVQTAVARWPSERGAGYIDSDTGWILPGHITAAVLVAVITVIYLIGWPVLWPPSALQLPPLAYLLFVVTMLGTAAAGAAFFLDRFRVPLLTALVASLVGAILVGGTDHEFIVLERKLSEAPTVAQTISVADQYRAAGSAVDPIIIVAAGGGGAHQAAWTTRVLTGLTTLWGTRFSGNLRLISAVSAGTVGATHYVLQFQNGPPDGQTTEGDENNLENAMKAAKAAATADVWWGITYPDLTRTLWPLGGLIPATLDRGRALELAWCHAMNLHEKCNQPTMGDWRARVAQGRQPAVAFNAMVVETGQRAVLATYGVRTNEATKDLAWITGDKDLSVITAARLAATFPYVTPVARPSNGAQSVHLIDGGYWDNHAVVTILEWLLEAEINGRPVLIIKIPPPPEPQTESTNRAWPWQTIAPLQAGISMRTDAQRTRNDLEQKLFDKGHAGIVWAEFPYQNGDASSDTLLSWHLSRRERCGIDSVWNETYGRAANGAETDGTIAIKTVASVLNQKPSRWIPPSNPECPK